MRGKNKVGRKCILHRNELILLISLDFHVLQKYILCTCESTSAMCVH